MEFSSFVCSAMIVASLEHLTLLDSLKLFSTNIRDLSLRYSPP